MNITETWLDLKVNHYEDGKYEAYEAESDSRFETANWSSMRLWLRRLIDDTTLEVEALRDSEEAKG